MVIAGIALAVLALIMTSDARLTFGFIGGALASLAVLAALGEMVMRLMRRAFALLCASATGLICDNAPRLTFACDYYCLWPWLICACGRT